MTLKMIRHVLILSCTLFTTTLAADNSWHPPDSSAINDLEQNLNSEGIFGFIFDTSITPDDQYGRYNYCNMPHVRRREYVVAPSEYELVYVEVIHRHHKRTLYQTNTFPRENDHWYCDGAQIHHYSTPSSGQEMGADAYWQVGNSDLLEALFPVSGFPGTCAFPQITRSGLQDSWQHGRDIYEVYHDLLGFLPDEVDWKTMEFRVTNNEITSQVAGMVVGGMYGPEVIAPLHVQRAGRDSLEPQYPCSGGQALFNNIKSPDSQSSALWKTHLEKSKELMDALDKVSGIPSDADDWHTSYDHYFDNLSSRVCHSKPLPCKTPTSDECITHVQANSVFRLGQWEYSYLYRDAPSSLTASVALYGVFLAELAQRLRDQIKYFTENLDQTNRVLYRHNVAHDGSISRLLSLLQIRQMVWPGMGAEVIFELYRKSLSSSSSSFTNTVEDFYVRVLWGGRVLRSSNPDLGDMEFVNVQKLLDYVDALVGQRAESVRSLCRMSQSD